MNSKTKDRLLNIIRSPRSVKRKYFIYFAVTKPFNGGAYIGATKFLSKTMNEINNQIKMIKKDTVYELFDVIEVYDAELFQYITDAINEEIGSSGKWIEISVDDLDEMIVSVRKLVKKRI